MSLDEPPFCCRFTWHSAEQGGRSGTNFASGATVSTTNSGITMNNVTVTSATQIIATFAISGSATDLLGSLGVSLSGLRNIISDGRRNNAPNHRKNGQRFRMRAPDAPPTRRLPRRAGHGCPGRDKTIGPARRQPESRYGAGRRRATHVSVLPGVLWDAP